MSTPHATSSLVDIDRHQASIEGKPSLPGTVGVGGECRVERVSWFSRCAVVANAFGWSAPFMGGRVRCATLLVLLESWRLRLRMSREAGDDLWYEMFGVDGDYRDGLDGRSIAGEVRSEALVWGVLWRQTGIPTGYQNGRFIVYVLEWCVIMTKLGGGVLPDLLGLWGWRGVTAALAARDANTNASTAKFRTGARRNELDTRECTYPDFMKCQPLNFKGTEGVVELTQWIEKMESVFRISNYSVENQIKFSTCTLLGNALTWTEIKKLEVELWELKVKGTDVIGYNQRFQELALLCGRMFPEESDKIEKYVGGLPTLIHGSVVASKPKTMQEATKMAIKVMDKRIRTFADRQTESKRKFEDTSRNTQNQQQHQNKRQNTGRAYAAGTVEKKQYGGSKPLCSKCNYHHDGPCAPKCHKCNKVGHFTRDCRVRNANNATIRGRWVRVRKAIVFECGAQGHFKRECPKLKNNNNRGNQVGGGNAPAKVYAVGHAGTNPDSMLLYVYVPSKQRYASYLYRLWWPIEF
ncbi:putative reverse transcriptase domain-containing protein [Tanacetum coccineum]